MKKEYAYLGEAATTEEQALSRLVEIVGILRKQCPWDKVQTHKTLTKCMLEESYEAVDAINKEDFVNLREELGDVMLQVIFHANLAEEEGKFTLVEVINEECEKMIRRHPHIFSQEEAKTIDKVLEKWENVKSKEHGHISHTQRLIDVPDALPALMKSNKVQKRAAEVGFDWDNIDGPLAKVEEELEEFKEALNNRDADNMNEELGDLLFSVVNVSRFAGIDPEASLNEATAKFVKRFNLMEERAKDTKRDFDQLTLAELEELWESIK